MAADNRVTGNGAAGHRVGAAGGRRATAAHCSATIRPTTTPTACPAAPKAHPPPHWSHLLRAKLTIITDLFLSKLLVVLAFLFYFVFCITASGQRPPVAASSMTSSPAPPLVPLAIAGVKRGKPLHERLCVPAMQVGAAQQWALRSVVACALPPPPLPWFLFVCITSLRAWW